VGVVNERLTALYDARLERRIDVVGNRFGAPVLLLVDDMFIYTEQRHGAGRTSTVPTMEGIP